MSSNPQGKYSGNDNYGRPKQAYLDKIAPMSDHDLERETYQIIYQAARCSNNPRADWHWMADACYDESRRRDGGEAAIYKRAFQGCYEDFATCT
jgi:hypothetical protein